MLARGLCPLLGPFDELGTVGDALLPLEEPEPAIWHGGDNSEEWPTLRHRLLPILRWRLRHDELSLQPSPGSLRGFASGAVLPEPVVSGGVEHFQTDADAAGCSPEATALMVVGGLATHGAMPHAATRRLDATLSLSACETVTLQNTEGNRPNQTDEHAKAMPS